MTADLRDRRVLMLVENLSVPLDRRVWQEATTLRDAGCHVVVVSPRGSDRDREGFELREGIEIHRFRPAADGAGALGYVKEYAVALARIFRLVRRLARRHRFDVVHVANPPDALLLTALLLRRRARFVFDHHDLAPELYVTKFGRRDLVHRLLLVFEWISMRLADVVISTNDSYREVAVGRGGKTPNDVFVVRNAPDPAIFRPGSGSHRRERDAFIIGYVGMMGAQDGVDHALRALAMLRQRRTDWRAIFAGDGDERPALEQLGRELSIDDLVDFRGLVTQDEVVEILSEADVCLAPEPSNALNDKSTMMKVAEYMSMARPVVAFDLAETRRTAGDAALYAASGDVAAYADLIGQLLDDGEWRELLGSRGRRRVVESLGWERSAASLLAAYERLLRERM